MGDYLDEPVIHETDFEPEADVFHIAVSKKKRKGTKDGKEIVVEYWEGCWDIPKVARGAEDTRKRPQVTASSTNSFEEAREKCREKVILFWLDRGEELRKEARGEVSKRLTKEQRAAQYTVQSFLEEWFASKTNPNTDAANRWRPNTARNNKTMLVSWIYPYLGKIGLTELTHETVRLHFTETLPSVLDDNDQRILGDQRIRGIYSTFRNGMKRAGAKGLIEPGEFLDVGIQMSFEPAGVPEDIDNLMWEMNALLKRPEVLDDPRALRWALAYGQGLRRGERCGLKWSDVNFDAGTITVRRQLSYVIGQPEFLDERLKAGDARTVPITEITFPYLDRAERRRQELIANGTFTPNNDDFADLVLLRDNGTAEKLNHDNALFHEFMNFYGVAYRNLSPGSLRHAAATYWANYGGPDGRGVSREKLREFLGHSAGSDLDAYYARASQNALTREFSGVRRERAPQATSTPQNAPAEN